VSTADASRMANMARAVQGNVASMRAVRLARIEDAIRGGNYQPSASQVANRLLDAAEIDSHLRAILGS
jgi:anti-sigma28 factor (negative regulator of flagellin synthesis)